MGSSSSFNISAKDFTAVLEIAYAPQNALPFLTTPEEVNITLGFLESTIKGVRYFVNKYVLVKFILITLFQVFKSKS